MSRPRFLKISSVYSEFVRSFVADLPADQNLSSAEIAARFARTAYVAILFPAHHMEAHGYESHEIYMSLKPLQQAWARENGLSYTDSNWHKSIAIAQVRQLKPEVIFLQDLYVCDADFRRELRAVCPPHTRLIGWRGAPTEEYSQFRDLDLTLSCNPHYIERMREAGATAELLPLSFEPQMLDRLDTTAPRPYPLTFAGSIGSPFGIWAGRERVIERLLEDGPLELWANFVDPVSRFENLSYHLNRVLDRFHIPRTLRTRLPIIRLGAHGMSKPGRHPIQTRFPERIHPPVFGLAYYQLLAQSRITLNNHGENHEDYAANVRLYEATGMGACLLTDWKSNLHELFEPETEVVTYRHPEEAAEKVRYLLDHDDQREAIAKAGQHRTLRDHTSANRAARLAELIRERG
jgi:spore maturation protein CgeB